MAENLNYPTSFTESQRVTNVEIEKICPTVWELSPGKRETERQTRRPSNPSFYVLKNAQ
jgi:hypothetical protein